MALFPLITVVMPAYNASSYIADSILSVINQSLKEIELLVINDCSSDNTADIVSTFASADKRIRLINLPCNRGAPAGPRNIGILEAKGKLIAFLDSDDVWHPAKLERQVEIMASTGARFCSTQMREFFDASSLVLDDFAAGQVEWVSFRQQLVKFRTPTSSVIAERSLLLANPFNEDIRYKAREDLDCWLHCHEEIGRSIKLTVPMMGYRIIPSQISGNKWTMLKRHFYVLENYRFRSGHVLGARAWLYTFTHFFISLYYRKFRKML